MVGSNPGIPEVSGCGPDEHAAVIAIAAPKAAMSVRLVRGAAAAANPFIEFGSVPFGSRSELEAAGSVLLYECDEGAYCFGTSATTRTGPPDPPSIFIGRANTSAPVGGTWLRLVRFSRPGTFAAAAMRWTMKSLDGP